MSSGVVGSAPPAGPFGPPRPSRGPGARPLKVPIDYGLGAPVVILPGFGLTPSTYADTARALGRHCRVLVADIYGVSGPWSYQRMLTRLTATLDDLELERVTLIGHSFGGSLELGLTARSPQRVVDAVFVDTLAMAREWVLAREAFSHPEHLLRLATKKAALAFFHNAVLHPRQLAGAAWWGFRSARSEEIDAVAAAGVRTHVLWANRDSLLDRADGRTFAEQLRATFAVVGAEAGVIDHDWMYRYPRLFVSQLLDLGLEALGGRPSQA